MRNLSAVNRLNKQSFTGLTDYLGKAVELADVLSETNITNLTYLASGNDFANAARLFYSAKFEELMARLRQEYDFVIFDTPALASFNDGFLVGSKADAIILVVKMGMTKLRSIKRIREQFEKSNTKFLGILLNKVNKSDYKKFFES
jgi:capsular exopolysaccharide synthesis family protein